MFGSFSESKSQKTPKKLQNYKLEHFCGALFQFDYSTQKQMDNVSFSCPISVRFPSDIKHMAKATDQRDSFNIITESQH